MENQNKKFPQWGFRGLLLVTLSGIAGTAFAQGAEVCQGIGYTIADAVPASAGSEYRWLENGNVLANTNQAAYNVPNSKEAGVYTYVRQSKSADCPDWQSSNEFTLTVFACSFTAGTETGATATFTDPRDGKQYKTVVMPDGRTWFAQNLNYTKDLTFNAYTREANGKKLTSHDGGALAIGSYWCPGVNNSTYSGDQNMCNIYGAIYTWQTVMMVDGKYADESRTNSAWDESWVSPYYYTSGVPGTAPNADRNNARGGTSVKDGGRGICPMGWHIPTACEWAIMLDSVEGDGNGNLFSNNAAGMYGKDVGLKLKSVGTYKSIDPGDGSWFDSGSNGQDLYSFGVLPNGGRGYSLGNPVFSLGVSGIIHSATLVEAQSTLSFCTWCSSPGAEFRYLAAEAGRAVRCLMD